MKIILIIDDLFCGGTESVLASRVVNLPAEVELKVIAVFAKGNIGDLIEKAGIEIEFLDAKVNGYRKSICRAREFLLKQMPDVVVCLRDVSRSIFPLFVRRLSLPLILFWDNPCIRRSLKQSIAEFIQVKISKPCMLASSSHIAASLQRYYPDSNVKVIHNCYDEKRFYPDKHQENPLRRLRIISVGNMRPEKQHSEKNPNCGRVEEKRPEFRIHIYRQR